MGPDDLLLIVMLTALTLYALAGRCGLRRGRLGIHDGASGVRQRAEPYLQGDRSRLGSQSCLADLRTGHSDERISSRLRRLSRALWLPLLLALCGIVFRGASYAFRSHSHGSQRERRLWEAVFAIASTATPLFLGHSAGRWPLESWRSPQQANTRPIISRVG